MPDEPLSPDMYRRLLRRVLENIRRALYEIEAAAGLERAMPRYTAPQILPMAAEALFLQSALRAARIFDHHPRAISYFKLRDQRPGLIAAMAAERRFDLKRLDDFAGELRRVRNRALAHDDQVDFERNRDAWREVAFTTSDIIACLEFAFAALNEALERDSGERVPIATYSGQDAEELARTADRLGLPQKWASLLG